MKFKTKKYKKGELIADISEEGLHYLEKGLVHLNMDKAKDFGKVKNLMELSKPDDDYWEDYDSLNIMKTLNDRIKVANMRKDESVRDEILDDIIKQQITDRPKS